MTEKKIKEEVQQKYPMAFRYIFDTVDEADYDKAEEEMLAMQEKSDGYLWRAVRGLKGTNTCPPSVLKDAVDFVCDGCKICWRHVILRHKYHNV